MPMSKESHVFDPRPWYNLKVTAKRYWRPQDDAFTQDPDALTLILTHGAGFHKEQWEPTMDDLYKLLDHRSNGSIKIREIWSIDCPNHGDAAVLNEEELEWGYSHVFGWDEYARAVHAFLTGRGKGIPVDFSTRKLVGIGHSIGAVALILSTTYLPSITYSSLILVDPTMFPKPPSGSDPMYLANNAEQRRDIWPSRPEALHSLQSRSSFKKWDPRVLQIFVECGMRDLPTPIYPDHAQGVTLKCPKSHEAGCYRDAAANIRALGYLKTLCELVPVHIMYGAIDDYLPPQVKSYVITAGTQGKHASFTRVPNAGHLIPQVQPMGLALAIHAALQPASGQKSLTGITTSSRL